MTTLGFMSRCANSLLCMKESPSKICEVISCASASDRGDSSTTHWRRSPKLRYSIAMYSDSSCSYQPKDLTKHRSYLPNVSADDAEGSHHLPGVAKKTSQVLLAHV
jgi:hypothetical protein